MFPDLRVGEGDWSLTLEPAVTPTVLLTGPLDGLERDADGNPAIRWEQEADEGTAFPMTWKSGPMPVRPADEDTVRRFGTGLFDASAAVLRGPILRAPLRVLVGDAAVDVADPTVGPILIDVSELLAPPARRVVIRLVAPEGWPVPAGTLTVDTVKHEVGVPHRSTAQELAVSGGLATVDVPYAAGGGSGILSIPAFEAAGYRIDPVFQREIPVGRESLMIEVDVIPAGTVHGRISAVEGVPQPNSANIKPVSWPLDADGNPVPSRGSESWDRLFLGADGSFSVSGLPLGGRWRFTAVALDGFTLIRSEPFEVTLDEPIHEVRLEMPAGVDATVRVLGVDGRPAPGIAVKPRYGNPEGISAFYAVKTDDTGTVVLPGLNPGVAGGVRIGVPPVQDGGDGLRADVQTVPANHDASEPLAFRLVRGSVLAGRVVDDSTGKPLGGRGVFIEPDAPVPAGVWPEEVRLTTDADGRFHAGGLAPVAYRVTVQDTLPGGAAHTVGAGGRKRWTLPDGWADANRFAAPAADLSIRLHDARADR